MDPLVLSTTSFTVIAAFGLVDCASFTRCTMRINIIFVCTSNVCRSPIAEGLAKKWLCERHGVGFQDLEQIGYKVQSRGISTEFEPLRSPASPHGIAIMKEKHSVDMTAHRSAMLSKADVLEATHIYCMAQRHHDAVRSVEQQISSSGQPSLVLSPASVASSHSAAGDGKKGSSSPRIPVVISVFHPEIPDPWHGTIECYKECTEMVAKAVKGILEEDVPLVQNPRLQQQEGSSANIRDQEEDSQNPQS